MDYKTLLGFPVKFVDFPEDKGEVLFAPPLGATITEFRAAWRFLSNFWPAPVILDAVTYPTVEHAYQAAKTLSASQRDKILDAPTPGEAKKLGRRSVIRPGWDEMKLSVMESLVRQKFQSEPLRSRLLGTGSALLVEGNTWGDEFWGVCNGVGRNHLGRILMTIRAESQHKEKTSRG